MNLDKLETLASRLQALVSKIRRVGTPEAEARLVDAAAVASDAAREAWQLWLEVGQKAPRQRGR